MTRVFSHFTIMSKYAAAKKARKGTSNDTSSLSRIKVIMEVSQLTNPFTPFLVIQAANFETFDFSLEMLIEYSIREYVWFTTCGALHLTNTE